MRGAAQAARAHQQHGDDDDEQLDADRQAALFPSFALKAASISAGTFSRLAFTAAGSGAREAGAATGVAGSGRAGPDTADARILTEAAVATE